MSNTKVPYFLWDYNLNENDVKQILRGKNDTEKIWLTSRILESAKYEDIWRFLNLREIKEIFPRLKLKKPIKEAWDYALNVWENAR